jgi:uncharacterized protein (DUF2147 family)
MSHSAAGRILIGVVITFGITTGSAAQDIPTLAALTPTAPLGLWTTANGSGVIEIGWCGATLCGWIVGIKRAPDEPVPKDYQGRSQCDLAIITDERPTQDGNWLGHVIDPRDGKTYQAEFWVDDAGRLNLRGFIGIPLLGRTEKWHRFTGHLTRNCGVA